MITGDIQVYIRCKPRISLNRPISPIWGSEIGWIWGWSGSGPLGSGWSRDLDPSGSGPLGSETLWIWTPPDLDPSDLMTSGSWILGSGGSEVWVWSWSRSDPPQIWRSENRYYLIILSRARVVGKRPVWWVLHQCYTLFYKGEIAEIRDFGRSKVVQKRVRNRTFAYFDPKIDPFWLRITNLDVLNWSIIG